MKVLYYHQHFSTPAGATGIRSYEMAKRLIARGHQVLMICGSYGGAQTGLSQPFVAGMRRGLVDGIDVIEFELPYSNRDGLLKRTWTFLKFAARSSWFALREPCDLVFATTTPLTAAIPGIVARVLRGRRFVFEVRDLWPELPREMGVIKNPVVLTLMSWLEWSGYHAACRVIGLSPGIVEGVVRRGIARERVAMVPNGCDIDLFDTDASLAWRPPGVAASDLMAVFAGTHGQANGLGAVLDAAAVLKARGRHDIKLVLIGQGKLKSALKERAAREGLHNVIFHDSVNKRQLSGLMAATNVGMQVLANIPAFYFGTSPNKFFDYLSAGLPVLNNYPGWLAGLLQEQGAGVAVPPDDPNAFADALISMADNREALAAMGVAAKRLAREQFDRARLSNQFVDWLEGAVRA
ncbi:glycosyltransferase family 4 protein [Andreprevotia chitinilytica]|uniref:glycosyltransferase family 4 protein n=1 Tax=Andreprevotia chitinilytica TaxID=396808 RepID=UPI0005521ABA|nr:glycosyltransferase family 4 protein [Andreprevotia chitinilytica]